MLRLMVSFVIGIISTLLCGTIIILFSLALVVIDAALNSLACPTFLDRPGAVILFSSALAGLVVAAAILRSGFVSPEERKTREIAAAHAGLFLGTLWMVSYPEFFSFKLALFSAALVVALSLTMLALVLEVGKRWRRWRFLEVG